MASLLVKLAILFVSTAILGSLVSGADQEPESLRKTLREMMVLENTKLEAISGFLTALLTLIGLIPKAILQLIIAKVQYFFNLAESVVAGLGGMGAIKSAVTSALAQQANLGAGGQLAAGAGGQLAAGAGGQLAAGAGGQLAAGAGGPLAAGAGGLLAAGAGGQLAAGAGGPLASGATGTLQGTIG